MAYVETTGGLMYPGIFPSAMSGAPSVSSVTAISTAGSKYAVIFQADRTGDISTVLWRYANVTTAPSSCEVRIETVDTATGFPTGTLVGTNTSASIATTSNTSVEVTLTANASVTIGTLYAIVLVPSGTFNLASGSLLSDDSNGTPQFLRYDGTTWTIFSGLPPIAYKYSDGAVPKFNNVLGYTLATTVTISNTSNPNHRGLRTIIPFKAKAVGCYAWVDLDADVTFKLIGSDGTTVLRSVNAYANIPLTANAGPQRFLFSSEVELTANTTYYLIAQATTATTLSIYYISTHDSTYNVFGDTAKYTTAQNPTGTGSWTTTGNQIPYIGLILSAVDDGAAGGGGGGSTAYSYSSMS